MYYNDLFRGFSALANYEDHVNSNSYETNGKFSLEFSVPGFTKDEISVTLDNDKLIVDGKKQERRKKDGCLIWETFKVKDFTRVVKLNKNYDPENVTCELKDGILYVEIGKNKSKTKLIKIQ